MSQPLPVTTRIRSDYQDGKAPAYVAKWEKWANNAPTDAQALLQLVYFQALQIRAIKLVLIWTLIILPIVVAIGFVLLDRAIASSGTRF